MKEADSRTKRLALRAWLEGNERNADRIAKYAIDRAIADHIGYFRFVLDAVDGPIRLTAEEEWTFEPDCVLVVADDGREAEPAIAAWSTLEAAPTPGLILLCL
jgi:hypothetical protein